MLEKSNLLTNIGRDLSTLELGECLDIRSYKRNRSIVICREKNNEFLLIENGFDLLEFKGDKSYILKQLKRAIKREFPRSNKVRIYRDGITDPHSLSQLRRKKI